MSRLFGLFGARKRSLLSNQNRTAADRKRRTLACELLEDRWVPAGTASLALDGSGNLLISDTTPGGHNDNLQLLRSGSSLQISDGSGATLTVAGSISGAAGSGTSTVTVPLSSITGSSILTYGLG